MADSNSPNASYGDNKPKPNYGTNPDFLAFNESPKSRFTPTDCSSPITSKNYRKKNWNPNRFSPSPNFHRPRKDFSGNYSGSESFNNSRGSRRNSYGSRSNSYGSQYNSYGSPNTSYGSRNNSWSRKSYNKSMDTSDISAYLHPSFMEDPWRDLEEAIKRKQSQGKSLNETSDSQHE